MSSGPDFRDLVGEDVPADERERLRRVHDLLVAAGPPAELSPTLERAPDVGGRVAFLPRRRRVAALLLAAALAAAVFGGGFLAGAVTHGGGKTSQAEIVVPMHGTSAASGALASIRILAKDKAGNWPMLVTVQGLPKLPSGGYYELYLTRHGRIAATCGTFNVQSGKTTVSLNAPYALKRFDGWVVTRHLPGRPEEANRPLLTT
jgi:anti-sigma-K factor RskA